MARFKVGFNKKVNVTRVITKIVVTVLSIYVGGALLTAVGTAINGTTSGLNNGLTLIGWTVTNNKVDATNPANTAGILTVVGLVGIASVIMEFVQLKMI
jgi:hypothetical protein